MSVSGPPHAPVALPQGSRQVPIAQNAEWDPGPFWTGAGNLTATGIRSPDRPVGSRE